MAKKLIIIFTLTHEESGILRRLSKVEVFMRRIQRMRRRRGEGVGGDGGVSSKKPDVIPAPFVSASSQRLRLKALTLRPDSTDARTQTNSQRLFLSHPVSQSVNQSEDNQQES